MRTLTFIVLTPLALTGCPRNKDALTLGQATQAIEEASLASQAEGLTATSVDISTNFTIGDGVAAAADELRGFVASQLPCAEITLTDATLTIDYGVNAGSCTYRGQTFSGSHAITVSHNETAKVEVRHQWSDLSNGVVSLNGTAEVTWDFEGKSRRVVHDSEWTSVRTGKIGRGSGDRTQTLLAGGLAEGIRVDGIRSWSGSRGDWDLAISGVEMRWQDPVPQAGSYSLSTPFDKNVTLSFERVDGDTIGVTVAGPEREFTFTVSKLGVVTNES